MLVDWPHFTPWASLLGGLLIGVASIGLLLANGRIAGISGIFGGLLRPQAGEWPWRLAFVLGLMLAPWIWRWFQPLPTVHVHAEPLGLLTAGLLVGLGTRYASGCTSGHAVCGLSRLSVRSLAATLSFMASGFLTVFLIRHALA